MFWMTDDEQLMYRDWLRNLRIGDKAQVVICGFQVVKPMTTVMMRSGTDFYLDGFAKSWSIRSGYLWAPKNSVPEKKRIQALPLEWDLQENKERILLIEKLVMFKRWRSISTPILRYLVDVSLSDEPRQRKRKKEDYKRFQ